MRRALLSVVVLVPLCAGALSKDVQKYLNSASTLIENLDYEKALKQIERAKTKSQGADDDAQIAFYEGVVFSEQGKNDKALTAFKTGLSMDPDAKLPLEVSPKVERNFEEARANVKKMLAPQLQKEEDERKRAEAERLEAERKKEEERKAEEERARLAAMPKTTSGGTVTKTSSGGGTRTYAWVPMAAGAALGGAGAFFLVSAKGNYDSLISGTVAPANAAAARDTGKSQQTTGLALTGIGVAAIAAGGAMYLMGGDAAKVSVIATPGGAFVGVSGSLP
jgi:tetratricopeptide (TPR) repeat protein